MLPAHVEHEAGRARVLRHVCRHCRGIHHDSPSGRGEEETFGALQRRLDVVPVVHVLGGLDGIEEPLVHEARPDGRLPVAGGYASDRWSTWNTG